MERSETPRLPSIATGGTGGHPAGTSTRAVLSLRTVPLLETGHAGTDRQAVATAATTPRAPNDQVAIGLRPREAVVSLPRLLPRLWAGAVEPPAS